MVYDDAEQLYSEVRKDCQVLLENALGVLFSDSVPLSENSSISQPFNVIAVNTSPFARRDIIKIPLLGVGKNLLPKPLQSTVDGKYGYVLLQTQEHEILAKSVTVSTEHGPVSGKCAVPQRVRNLTRHVPSVHQWLRPLHPEEFKFAAHNFAGTHHQLIRCEIETRVAP